MRSKPPVVWVIDGSKASCARNQTRMHAPSLPFEDEAEEIVEHDHLELCRKVAMETTQTAESG